MERGPKPTLSRVFHQMQVSGRKLTPSAPFCGVTNEKTISMGKIELPITFGGRDNFRTESITFDVAPFDLPYNAILGRPALAKFMATVHYAYSTLKIPRPSGVITIKADVKGAVHCAEKLFEAVAAASLSDEEHPESTAHPTVKQCMTPNDATLTKSVRLRDNPEKTITVGAKLGEK